MDYQVSNSLLGFGSQLLDSSITGIDPVQQWHLWHLHSDSANNNPNNTNVDEFVWSPSDLRADENVLEHDTLNVSGIPSDDSDSELSIDDDEESFEHITMEELQSGDIDGEIMDCTDDTDAHKNTEAKANSDDENCIFGFRSPLPPPNVPLSSSCEIPSPSSNDIYATPMVSDSHVGIPLYNGCEDHWSWNPKDKSHEVRLNGPKSRIAHFHPNWSNGTAGVRGTRILNGGRYYWEINVSQRIFGTSMMFGIGTKRARLHVDAFVNMLGEDDQSWGLSHKGYAWHQGKHRQYTQPFRENIATTIGIYFDGLTGTLTYFKDYVSLGVAFTGLHEVSEPLYPMICSTAAKTEMSLGAMKREFVSMQDRCRATIIKSLTDENQIEQLLLPRTLKRFIAEGLSEDGSAADDLALAQNNILQQRGVVPFLT